MEIQSFILGMVGMLVIALAIGSVFAVVKVIKISSEFREIQIWINQEFERTKEREKQEKMIVNDQLQEVYRTIDSRVDKLYEKMLKEFNPKNRILQLITSGAKGDEPSERA